MKQSIYKIFEEDFKNIQKDIIIWGSGSGYTRWKDKIDFHSKAIIDNNSKLWGTFIDGVPLVAPDTLISEDRENTIVIILSFFYEEIKKQVCSYGLNETNIYCFKDLERTIFFQEKQQRQMIFQSKNTLTLKDYIENMENDLKDFMYRGVYLLPVLGSYIALLTNYLFLEDSNSHLFPVPKKREYYIHGNGPFLVSYVWHEQRRPSLHDLVEKSISEIPGEFLTKLKPKSFYDEEDETCTVSFSNDSIPISVSKMVLRIRERICHERYHLLDYEINWFVDFIQYFIGLIDFYYSFFEKRDFSVFISAFSNNAEDNIKVQIAKNLGIKTFGLQHGTYGDKYEFDLVPFSHVYKYPTVDELLVWGDYSAKIIERIQLDHTKVTAVGNPRYNFTTTERVIIKKEKQRFLIKKVFLVSFTGPGEREFSINQELVSFADRIAEVFNLEYIVKMHPENKILPKEFSYSKKRCRRFISGNEDINSLYGDVDFIITTSSIVIHESVYLFIPVFVYNIHHAVQSICGPLSTVFNEYEELEVQCNSMLDEKNFSVLLDEYEDLGNDFFKSYPLKRPSMTYKEIIYKK